MSNAGALHASLAGRLPTTLDAAFGEQATQSPKALPRRLLAAMARLRVWLQR